eukprot:6207747-Pleurochrysis_carterae.AAC.6
MTGSVRMPLLWSARKLSAAKPFRMCIGVLSRLLRRSAARQPCRPCPQPCPRCRRRNPLATSHAFSWQVPLFELPARRGHDNDFTKALDDIFQCGRMSLQRMACNLMRCICRFRTKYCIISHIVYRPNSSARWDS